MSGNDSGITSGNQISIEQGNVETTVTVNEANIASAFEISNIENSATNFDPFPKKLNTDKQGKHIPGHKNYQSGKSKLTISMSEASKLVAQFSGKGTAVASNKERVNFGKIIGFYKDPSSKVDIPTSIGIIHYSKTGAHIVPARPKET